MPYRVERGGFQHVKHVVTQCDGTANHDIDMTLYQLVGVLVVGTEHQLVGVGRHQRDEGFEILCCAAFADEDLHAEADFLQGAFEAETLVVGGDARAHIFLQVDTRHCGGMSVDGFVVFLRGGNLAHQFGVVVDDAGVVHHLREVIDVGRGHQFFDVVGINGEARRLEIRRRHTARRTEEELERHFLAVVDHVADALLAQHIGDFVRVADGGHRAMARSQPSKFRRHEHRALDVHMRIDEARHDVSRVAHWFFFYLADYTVFNDDNA